MAENIGTQLAWIDGQSAASEVRVTEIVTSPPQEPGEDVRDITLAVPSGENMAPMLKQYLEIKRQYPEHTLLFQVGDFYEIFFDDARKVSDVLSIRLTSRDKNNPNPIPMCGVPLHAIDNYLPRLLRAGLSCVIVEQVEEASPEKKGGVKREITRVVTPGVRLEGDGLEAVDPNYLAAALFTHDCGTIAFADVSTGSFHVLRVDSVDELIDSLERIRPAELLLPSTLFSQKVERDSEWLRPLKSRLSLLRCQLRYRPFGGLRGEECIRRIVEQFGANEGADVTSLRGQLADLGRECLSTVDAVIDFVAEVSFGRPPRFSRFLVAEKSSSVFLDGATCRNLELFETRVDGERKNSLLARIDETRTAMGSRLLCEWLSAPLTDIAAIEERHDAVGALLERAETRRNLREALLTIRDLERLTSRIASNRVSPRDLAALRDSLERLPEFASALSSFEGAPLSRMATCFDPLTDISERLQQAIALDPPGKLIDGGVIREGFSSELDAVRTLQREASAMLSALEAKEREATGIQGLKIRYTNVFGYFLEVTKTHIAKVPDHYERRQTLANAERYVTKELKEFESRVLRARDEQLELEKALFSELRDWVISHSGRIQRTASCIAELDVLMSLAEIASRHGYKRPTFVAEGVLNIQAGRHPVVEQVLSAEQFTPNDTRMDGDTRRFALLTGPNMGGKSTYLRQVALIQLLAQIGSFVPAESAQLGIVDRIFTRIGAADDLARGDSTFMVEMREAATIIRKASDRSLVLIDELGRGTATTDGLALATAIAEWLLERVRCKTIFATHFHELTELASSRDGAFCLSVGVVEKGSEIGFTHRIEEKVGGKSYGLDVARLAGLPRALVDRARQVLDLLLTAESDTMRAFADAPVAEPALPSETLKELRELRLDTLTPLQALNELHRLQQLARSESIE